MQCILSQLFGIVDAYNDALSGFILFPRDVTLSLPRFHYRYHHKRHDVLYPAITVHCPERTVHLAHSGECRYCLWGLGEDMDCRWREEESLW